MNEQIYRKLAKQLDQLPDGFPPSRMGANLRLMEKLFRPEEAELAVHLTLDQESAGVIAARAALAPEVVEQRLSEMAKRGLTLSIQYDLFRTSRFLLAFCRLVWNFLIIQVLFIHSCFLIPTFYANINPIIEKAMAST